MIGVVLIVSKDVKYHQVSIRPEKVQSTFSYYGHSEKNHKYSLKYFKCNWYYFHALLSSRITSLLVDNINGIIASWPTPFVRCGSFCTHHLYLQLQRTVILLRCVLVCDFPTYWLQLKLTAPHRCDTKYRKPQTYTYTHVLDICPHGHATLLLRYMQIVYCWTFIMYEYYCTIQFIIYYFPLSVWINKKKYNW